MYPAEMEAGVWPSIAARSGLASPNCHLRPLGLMNASATQDASGPRRLQTRLLLALLAITLAVFVGVCGHEFVQFDDNVNIYANPRVHGLTWENLRWMFTDTDYARRYMPLGWLCYAVDYQVFGLNPQAFHVGNLLFHLTNVVLLYFLLKRLLLLASARSRQGQAADFGSRLVMVTDSLPRQLPEGNSSKVHCNGPTSPDQTGTAPVWCAALGALFWAVNPLRVEAVAWASSRIYCVVFLLTAGSLLAWLKARDPATPRHRQRRFYWLAVACYAGSLFTYPLALFAPVALFILEVYPLRQIPGTLPAWCRRDAWPVWRDKIPFLIVACLVVLISLRARVSTDALYRPVTLEEVGPLSRLMQALYIWAYYAWKPWAPYDLSATYSTLHSFNPLGAPFLASAAFVLLASGAVLLLRRRWPAALWLWACHLAILVPVLGLTEYPHSAYDRYSYLHGILWSAALAALLYLLWERGKQARLVGMMVSSACMLFALCAWQQVTVWSSTIALYQHIVAHLGEHPSRARFDEVLGLNYLRCGLTNEAVASFQNALYYESRRADRNLYEERLLPRTHIRLGEICEEQGQHGDALTHYEAAFRLDANSVESLLHLGSAHAKLGHHTPALRFFKEALRLQPDNARAHEGIAEILRQSGA